MPFIFKVFFTLVSLCFQKKTKWNEILESFWYLPFLSLFKFIGNVNMLREAKDLLHKVITISYKMKDVADNHESLEELQALLLDLSVEEKKVLEGVIKYENSDRSFVGITTDQLTWIQRFRTLFKLENHKYVEERSKDRDSNQQKTEASAQKKAKQLYAQNLETIDQPDGKISNHEDLNKPKTRTKVKNKPKPVKEKQRKIKGSIAIQKEIVKAETYVSHLQSKIQAFNIYKTVLEDLPQTILQLSVLANEGRIDGQLKTILSTIALNMASTIINFSKAYLMMPFLVENKSLNNDSDKSREKAPYKTVFNFPFVIVCMTFIVTPRLLMVALWTSNRDLDLMPIPLIILGDLTQNICMEVINN